jgi:putative phosphoesterase
MKIAFLSDIHANIEAFNSVLSAIDKEGVDAIYIAGDLVGYYYHPDKVIDICMSRSDIYCIRGNHDRNFLDALNNENLMSNLVKKYGFAYALTKKKLNKKQISWLKNLPTQLKIEINQITITIAHGSIRSEDEYVYPNKSIDSLNNQLSDSDFTVLGHTHHPFLWSHKNKWLVNPGSVGQPRDQSGLSSFMYLDLENKTVLPQKIKFPIEKLEKEIEKYDPNNKYLKNILIR